MNEYLEKFLQLQEQVSKNPKRSIFELVNHRHAIVENYAWAIPTDEAIDQLVKLSPIVELGAGTGYWAHLVNQAGGQVTPFDLHPPTPEGNNPYRHKRSYTRIFNGDTDILWQYKDATLFLCWPPYDSSMAANALRNWNGNTLVYCGEGFEGCTANAEFFWLRDGTYSTWEYNKIPGAPALPEDTEPMDVQVEECMIKAYGKSMGFKKVMRIELPQWPTIHDTMTIWRR